MRGGEEGEIHLTVCSLCWPCHVADSQRTDVRFVYNTALETSTSKILRSYLRPEEAAMNSEQLYNSLAKSLTLHPPHHFYACGRVSILPAISRRWAEKGNKKGGVRPVPGLSWEEKMQIPHVRSPSVFCCLLGKCRVWGVHSERRPCYLYSPAPSSWPNTPVVKGGLNTLEVKAD